ncbi:MAG: metallophosphoesterase [Ignavibacteriales bacterium]|nr:metallophosphoesterase [Ignavibacteriales bacterium]
MSETTMYLIWMGIVLSVYGIGISYLGWRLITPFKLQSPYKMLAWTGLILMFMIPFSTFILVRFAEKASDALSWIGYVSLGIISFVFVGVFLRDIIYLFGFSAQKIYTLISSAPEIVDASKREFLLQTTNLAVIGAAGTLTAYGVYEARRRPSIINVDIPIARLPHDFDGFKIVQITDIHAGLTIKRDWIETVAEEVKNLSPDLIAFTGDLADGSVPHLKNDVAPLAGLTAPYGKFFVTGNHEYYSGAEAWVNHAREMGYDVLMNEYRTISKNGSSVVLAGVTDYSGGGFYPSHKSDPKKAFEGAAADATKILMAHQPRSLYQTDGLDLDLVLMGHTHGGQFFPWNFVATIGQPFIKGLNKWGEKTWAYVSKGTGYWGPPMRVGARSEITVLTLKKA